MKASSESGLWAQTISFTGELFIVGRSHYSTARRSRLRITLRVVPEVVAAVGIL